MNYLITGGAGFIGSHLSEALLAAGHRVTVLDDLSTGSLDNVDHLRDNDRFHCIVDTMMNRPVLADLVDEADGVFHLAAAVGVMLIVESPVRTIETNIRCTELLLELASRKGTRTMIASSSEVYGKSTAVPFREDGDLVLGSTSQGRWSYACSKAIDEFLALAYWREKHVPTVVARFFNTVGPRQSGRYGMVVPRFVAQALAGEPLTVFGSGDQSRCFGHVRDVVRGVIMLMEDERATGEVFNLGTQEEITIRALAERVRARVGSTSDIVAIPYDEAYEQGFEDMPRRVPSTAKIEELVGWQPELGLDDILGDVIAHERARGGQSIRSG